MQGFELEEEGLLRAVPWRIQDEIGDNPLSLAQGPFTLPTYTTGKLLIN